MNCDKEMGIGVIGVGGRGALAQHAHRPDEGVRLVAGADTSTEALAGFADRLGPDVFTTDDYRKLLARPNVDAVFITSPDYCHAEHAIAALTAGKAVFLEKPLAITIAQRYNMPGRGIHDLFQPLQNTNDASVTHGSYGNYRLRPDVPDFQNKRDSSKKTG